MAAGFRSGRRTLQGAAVDFRFVFTSNPLCIRPSALSGLGMFFQYAPKLLRLGGSAAKRLGNLVW
ncbi:MAG: hypothetical protein CVV21_10790 [Candidatus Goldiibacteriota bacterium HGW-Goldbacteria-1]|nr:MAG: hypothetical protein CVV21_10790 [Candidatus Goldiibacteriota bacterium HGW-Goldbacteria-1]